MGYSHNWTPKKASKENFKEFVEVCKKLKRNLPKKSTTAGGFYSDSILKINGGDGTGRPNFNKDYICFNGNENDDLYHETFYISRTNIKWNFCKTARKPYDLLVCACLIAANEILNYNITSDGNIHDWKPAIDFYLKTIYGEKLDENKLKTILPNFLFDQQKGTNYIKPYNLMVLINNN